MAPAIIVNQGEQLVGYWGESTSTIDWCERNYEVTRYVAEFWNSISNLFFIIPPLVVCIKLWHRKVERIYLLSLIYTAFTGLGSLAFHATLKYEMQLWDELAMVWSAIFLVHLIVKILKPEKSDLYAIPLVVYGLFTTVAYLFLKTPLIFQLAYAVLHYSVLILAYRLSKHYPADKRLMYATLIAHHVAFFLWNIDNNFCNSLENLRQVIPSSCLPFTQLHAVWHFLAGYGCFALILFCIQARLLSLNKQFFVSIDHISGLTLEEGCPTVLSDVQKTTTSSQKYQYVYTKQE